MARRRMFNSQIVESDNFIDLPLSAQALYFHLCMAADDDGFINGALRTTRAAGATAQDLEALLAANFLLKFDSGIICVKHWRMHNYLQKDRYTPTAYQEELAKLHIKPDKNYTFDPMYPFCTQNVHKVYTELYTECTQNGYTGKVSIELGKSKDSLELEVGKEREEATPNKGTKQAYGYYSNVLLTDEEYKTLEANYICLHSLIEKVSSYLRESGKEYNNHFTLIKKIAKDEGIK